MLKLRPIVLLGSIICAQSTIAEVNLNNMNDDNPTYLTSIPLLQSLKINNKQLQFNAPYVHELKNRYKVRSLFVESQDLPMVD
ncbi:MAG: insulinase family protein, partial [Acinetobacter sp.]